MYDKTPTSPDNAGDVSVLRRRAAIQRNRSLDGVRGIAALRVSLHRIRRTVATGSSRDIAVWIFFALSGLVLTRAWDGHYFAFLARRFVRLWPMYALCLGAATLLTASTPGPLLFFWYPLSANLTINPPAWSLVVEAWAMLAMPAFIWFGAGSVMRALMGVAICVLCAQIDRHIVFGSFFIGGAWLSRYDWRLGLLEHPFFQWLGRISYPLYLSHAVIIGDLKAPFIVEVLLSILVAQLLTMTVERWSIAGSRAILPYWRGLVVRRNNRSAALS